MYDAFKKIDDPNNIFKKDKKFDIQGIDMCQTGPKIQSIKDIEIHFKEDHVKIVYGNDYFIAGLLVFFYISEQEEKCSIKTNTDSLEWNLENIRSPENAENLIKILRKSKEVYILCGYENCAYHQCILVFQIEDGVPETYYYKNALKNWE